LAGTLFYIGFTGLEPILPSQVSKAAPGTAYGTALGFYNTAQFVGSAVGGPLAGYLANFPPDRTMFTMMVAAAIGFLMMVATKPTLSTEAARQYTSAHN
jgi:MFS family permease